MNVPDPLTTPAWRMEQNLRPYIAGILSTLRIKNQVLVSNEFTPRTAPFIVTINAHYDIATPEPGVIQNALLHIEMSGQIDGVNPIAHKSLVQQVVSSIVYIPKPHDRSLAATDAVLDAINFVPGRQDSRPCQGIHVWDLAEPSLSLGHEDSTATTSLMLRAMMTGYDWDGAEPYGH